MEHPTTEISPSDAGARVRDGGLVLVDVRPVAERARATAPVPHAAFEDGGLETLLALPRDQPLAFLCHHGVRSAQAARAFAARGFTDTYNVAGGIEAWSDVEASIPRY